MENFSEMTESCTVYSRVFQKGRDVIECSHDFILPDLYADIKRIVSSSGSIYPEECYVESGKVCVGGTLTVRVLFIDDEGALRSVKFTKDYSASFPLPDTESEDDITVICCPMLESVSVKTANPRKVSVRGRIDMGIKAWKKMSASLDAPELECECDSELETKKEVVQCIAPFSVEERELEVSDDITLDTETDEIIYCDAFVEVLESVLRDGTLDIKGNINTDVIYNAKDSTEPSHVAKRIPFANSLSLQGGVDENAVFAVCPYIRSLECEISDGEGGSKIEIDINYSLTVNGAFVTPSTCVCDAYMPAYLVETESERIGFSISPEKNTVSVRMRSCSDGALPEKSKVMLSNVQTQIESVALENGKKTALGNATVTAIYKNEDGGVSSRVISDSFEIDLSDMGDFDEYVFLMRVSPVSLKNEQDSLCAEYVIDVDVITWKSGSAEIIRTICVTEPESCDCKKPFTVYYPTKDESLWDVGKKYNVNTVSLASVNPESSGEELPKVLLIPRARINAKK